MKKLLTIVFVTLALVSCDKNIDIISSVSTTTLNKYAVLKNDWLQLKGTNIAIKVTKVEDVGVFYSYEGESTNNFASYSQLKDIKLSIQLLKRVLEKDFYIYNKFDLCKIETNLFKIEYNYKIGKFYLLLYGKENNYILNTFREFQRKIGKKLVVPKGALIPVRV